MESKKKRPRQTSKVVGVTLFDEEVEAWEALEKYFSKQQRPIQSPRDVTKFSAARVMREILHLALGTMAQEAGQVELLDRLAKPRATNPSGRPRLRPLEATTSQPKRRGRPPGSSKENEAAVNETRRIYWDRAWKAPNE